MIKKLYRGIFAMALLALPSLGNAAAVNLSEPGDGLFDGTPYTLGWEFTTNTDISVTSVGQFDAEGDGLANDTQIAIWDSQGAIRLSTVIPAGNSTTLTDFFRYMDVDSVLLEAGETFIIASYSAAEMALDLDFGAVYTVDPAITVLNDRYASVTGLVFPTEIDNPNNFQGWFGPNFQFTTQEVSEPGMLALLGFGLIGFAALRRKAA